MGDEVWWLKAKFFLSRFLGYWLFLLVPVVLPGALDLPFWAGGALMGAYVLFLAGQWLLLGREADHLFGIYLRAVSSADRAAYRVCLGMFLMAACFGALALLPGPWVRVSYWSVWAALGLLRSWPTRGRLIDESVAARFGWLGGLGRLDWLEGTVLGLVLATLVVTVPDVAGPGSVDALRAHYDPSGRLGGPFWGFLETAYLPFMGSPALAGLAWRFHFHFVGLGLYLLVFYAFLRAFVSRRLSILGVFALVSAWPVPRFLAQDPGAAVVGSFSLVWVWAVLWASRGSTYKTGLFLGMVGFWGGLVARPFAFLALAQVPLVFWFLGGRTPWFRGRLLKYSLAGTGMLAAVLASDARPPAAFAWPPGPWPSATDLLLLGKAFFVVAPLGACALLLKILPGTAGLWPSGMDAAAARRFAACVAVYGALCLAFDPGMAGGLSLLWVVAFLSLLPVEALIQAVPRLRPSRRAIYLLYVLICLLDSHLDGRIKAFSRMLD